MHTHLYSGMIAAISIALAAAPHSSSDDHTTSSSSSTTAPVEPVGIIALGHSGLTGENSDPSRPGQPATENSWATGTALDVNSIYQRLVAAHPETEGHVANAAQGGAPVRQLEEQARRALNVVPNPALVIIQTIDGDIRCDGSDAENVNVFGATLANALDVIVSAAPETKILLVGQLGRPRPQFIAELVAAEPTMQDALTGTGECDFYRPDGSLAESTFTTLIAIIEGYEAEQARVCAELPNCRTDDGARAAYIDDLDNFSSDWNHLNVQGQAQAAEIAWPSVATLLELEEARPPAGATRRAIERRICSAFRHARRFLFSARPAWVVPPVRSDQARVIACAWSTSGARSAPLGHTMAPSSSSTEACAK